MQSSSLDDEKSDVWWRPGWLFVAFFAVTVFAIADLASDWHSETSVRHLVLEAGIAVAGLIGMLKIAQHLRHAIVARRQAQALAADLSQRLLQSQVEADRWRADAADALRSVRLAIDNQLTRWGLTVTEQEVAMLLLKGLSHKEIAGIRNTSDATARQHATAIYRKSGLSGRNDLAAFFLEDLLVPSELVPSELVPHATPLPSGLPAQATARASERSDAS